MHSQYINLTYLEPAQLDMALAAGWYRIQQMLFTTDVLNFDEKMYQAIWLRVNLEDFKQDKTCRRLTNKNKHFRLEIDKLLIRPEHEDLFEIYKNHIPFETAGSLHSLLYGISSENVFNTHLINMYDGDTLIATGAFDLGLHSAAGIFSIYDPSYKQYSPGKYLIYKKMQFCKNSGYTWFYPGYYVPGYARFDYKKKIGKEAIEYYDREKDRWFALIG